MFDFKLLKELCLLDGTSGREGAVRAFIEKEIRNLADEIHTDALGSLIAFKKGKARPKNRVLFDAHMDEVGFIVTGATDEGFLRFSAVGGINPRVILGRRVTVGEKRLTGVIGTKALHMLTPEERDQAPDPDKLLIDIGAQSREEALSLVSPGDSAYFKGNWQEFGASSIAAKAIDDRAGCAALICLMREDLPYDTWFSFSTQEEVGGNGAKTAAFTVEPDIAVAVESTACGDVADVTGDARVCIYGSGAVVSFMDNGTIYDKGLYDHAFALAKERNIPCQTKTRIAGGNNAHVLHTVKSGVRVAAVSVPGKYIHSPYNVSDKRDIEAVYEMVKALAETVGAL